MEAKMDFELKGEYIELNKLLKLLNWVESGGMANAVISDGLVLVNGEEELRKRKKLKVGDVIQFEDEQIEIK